MVVFGEGTFRRYRSDIAHQIWLNLRTEVRNRDQEIAKYKEVIGSIKNGDTVSVQMPSQMARFLKRRLKQLKVPHASSRDITTAPITYLFKPAKP